MYIYIYIYIYIYTYIYIERERDVHIYIYVARMEHPCMYSQLYTNMLIPKTVCLDVSKYIDSNKKVIHVDFGVCLCKYYGVATIGRLL